MKKFIVITVIILIVILIIYGFKHFSEETDQSIAMKQLENACTNITRYTGISLQMDNAQLVLYHSTLGGPHGDGDALYFIYVDWFYKEVFNQNLQNADSGWNQQKYSIAESQVLIHKYCSWNSFSVTYNFNGEFDWCFIDTPNHEDAEGNDYYPNVRIAFYDEETGLLLVYIMDS